MKTFSYVHSYTTGDQRDLILIGFPETMHYVYSHALEFSTNFYWFMDE